MKHTFSLFVFITLTIGAYPQLDHAHKSGLQWRKLLKSEQSTFAQEVVKYKDENGFMGFLLSNADRVQLKIAHQKGLLRELPDRKIFIYTGNLHELRRDFEDKKIDALELFNLAHISILREESEILDFLIESGAPTTYVEDIHFSLILAAVHKNSKKSIEILLKHGVDPNQPAYPTTASAMSVIEVAEIYGDKPLLRLLKSSKPSP